MSVSLVSDAKMLIELLLHHVRCQADTALQGFRTLVVNLVLVQLVFGVVRLQANITDKVRLDLERGFSIS